jgi:hypothetical protein
MVVQLLTISSEEEAWDRLTEATQQTTARLGDVAAIHFLKWPFLNMHISTGDGSLSTPLMEIFIEYQKTLWRTYALIKYGTPKISFLTDEERTALQFDVLVRQGSTDAIANLTKSAGALLTEAGKKMSGNQLLILILGATLIVTGGVVLDADLVRRSELQRLELASQERVKLTELSSQEKVRFLELQRSLSEQDTAKMKILQEAYAREPKLRDVEGLVQAPREKFLRNVPSDAEVQFQDVKITGCVANKLARNTRRQGHLVTLRGQYRVIEIDSRKDFGFRVKVRNSQTGEELSANLSDTSENSECKRRISEAQMDRLWIPLVIESRRLGGKSVSATILNAAEPVRLEESKMTAIGR